MTATTSQLLSVCALLIECEELCTAGELDSRRRETRLRKCIDQVLRQFKLDRSNHDRLVAKTARDLIVNNVIHMTPREVKRK